MRAKRTSEGRTRLCGQANCPRQGMTPTSKHPTADSNRRWGAAAVEFAIVAPLLVSLVLGLIEFGRVLMVEQILTNAAREGCRTAVLDGSTTSDTSSGATMAN